MDRTINLVPPPAMLTQPRFDYGATAVMIFGEVPTFEAVMDGIATRLRAHRGQALARPATDVVAAAVRAVMSHAVNGSIVG